MRKPIRILYFIQLPPPIHGVSVINSQVYSSTIINKNFEKLLLEIKFSDRIDELRKISIKKIYNFLILNIKLVYTLVSKNPDIIYFSFMPVGKGFYRDLFFVFWMKVFRKKIIFHLHNRGIAKNSKRKFNQLLYKFVFNNSNIIHLSGKLIQIEFSTLGLKNVKFHIVPNGVDLNFSDVPAIKKDKAVRLLFFSNLFIEKGIFILLEVFEKICQKHQNVFLSIIGAPVDQTTDKLIQLLNDRKILKERVTYHGALFNEAKLKAFQDSDIFVFPSYFEEECFPLVILEAMAAGLPIIASDIGAIRDIVENGRNGYVVKVQDNEMLQKKYYLSDSPNRKKYLG